MQTRCDRQERLFHAIRLICRIDLDAGRVMHGLLAGTELTPARHRILEVLVREGRLTVAETARALSLKRQFAQRMISEMTACGLVETAANPAHSRSFHCTPTRRGCDLLDTIHTHEVALLDKHLGDLNTTEVVVALRVLRRVSDCFSDLAGGAVPADATESETFDKEL